jgi:hypothetical protein
MGRISDWPISDLKEKYNLKIAIETGTYKGGGARHLSKIFDKVYTIELMEATFNCVNFSREPKILDFLGKSTDVLPEILKDNLDVSTLFWLDAHLPSFYGHTQDAGTELPLEEELSLIIKHKDVSNDVFIIDDLRIYEDGPYAHGNWSSTLLPDGFFAIFDKGGMRAISKTDPVGGGIDFIYDLFQKTHSIEKDYRSEGYLALKPL